MVAAVSFYEMSTDCRMFLLSNALMKVSGCVPDLICIAQITRETLNNALPIHNWRLDFFGFKILPQFQALKNRLQCRENLKAKIALLLPNHISGLLIFEWKTTVKLRWIKIWALEGFSAYSRINTVILTLTYISSVFLSVVPIEAFLKGKIIDRGINNNS